MRRTTEDEEMDLLERQRGQITPRGLATEETNSPDQQAPQDPDYQRKVLVHKLKTWGALVLSNTNAALVAVSISAPIVLLLTLKLNDNMGTSENISSVTALLSLAFSFLMSALISGHPATFKSFTLTQASVLLIQTSRFGIGAVGATTLVVGLIIVVCYVGNLHRQLDLVPTCVVFGLKVSVGVLMLVAELPRAFGLPAEAVREGAGSTGGLGYVLEKRDQLSYISFGIFAVCITFFSILSARAPKLYWQGVFILVFLVCGYFLSPLGPTRIPNTEEMPRRTILGDDWGVFRNFDNKFTKAARYTTIPHQPFWILMTEPAFLINCGALAFMTLVEATSLAKLVDFSLKITTDKKKEMLGIGITNIVAGILGFLPVSLPVGRNLLVLQAGANSPIFGVIASVLTIIITYFFWGVMRHLPMLAISILSGALAVTLIDLRTLSNYWKHSPSFAAITTGMVVMSLFFNHFLAMLCGWVLFLILYSRADDVDNYGPGDIEFIVQEARIFECTNQHLLKRDSLNGDERPSTLVANMGSPLTATLLGANQIGWNSLTFEILQKVASEGAIYELRGRFNFLHAKTHLANIRRYHKTTVLIDFRKVFDEDIEFVLEYQYFISSLAQEPFAFYVTGIPYQRVQNDLILRGTWVEKLHKDHQIIFIN